MKKIECIVAAVLIASGCKEVIYQTGPESKLFSNDLLHGDIVGRVIQPESGARVVISQVNAVDSADVSPVDGSFAFNDLRAGNYTLTIFSDSYRTYRTSVDVPGGTITYVGDIELSTVPDLVKSHYPEDNGEIVHDWRWGRISISVHFEEPMDRESVEQAFSTDPPSEGIFYWGTYTTAPYNALYSDSYYYGRPEYGATITTFSRVRAMTYVMAMKDAHADTTYTVTLSTAAKDTAGNHLRFPLTFRFSTVQSYYTIYGIQTSPVNGDINVEPMYGDITLTFPRRMNPASTEGAVSLTPPMNRIFLWPDENVLRIYTGGPLLSDTTITVSVAESALDKDGIPLGSDFSFSFRTAPFRVSSTTPGNAEVFVSPTQPIWVNFNSYVIKSSVETAFSISPAVSGSFTYGGYAPNENRNQIVFTPSGALAPDTKYTVMISTAARDLHNVALKSPYSFSFIVRPN